MAESTWAPTPAATPIATLKKQVAGYCLMPTDTEALETALAGIQLAVDKINSRTWNWLVIDEEIIFDTAVIDYRLTSHFKKPQRLMLCDADGNTRQRLPFLDWQSFMNEYQDSTGRGDPCIYTVANIKEYGTLSLDVFPSSEFITKYPTGRVWYYRKCQRETESGGADWPSEFNPYVYHYACGMASSIYAPQRSGMAYGLAADCWRDLVRDDNQQQSDWE